MDVVLPETGCNIINSSSSFYNYSSDDRTRETYVIYDGKALLQSSSTSQYGYSHSGDCLVTGDLKYKPEIDIYFPFMSFCLVCFALIVIYNVIFKRLLP